jgi:hypothetical protein
LFWPLWAAAWLFDSGILMPFADALPPLEYTTLPLSVSDTD